MSSRHYTSMLIGVSSLVGFFSLLACGSDKDASNMPGQSCVTGSLRCECYANLTCNAGLVCASNLCVAPGGIPDAGGTTLPANPGAGAGGAPPAVGGTGVGGSVSLEGGVDPLNPWLHPGAGGQSPTGTVPSAGIGGQPAGDGGVAPGAGGQVASGAGGQTMGMGGGQPIGVGGQSAGVGGQSMGAGGQSAGVGGQSAGVGGQSTGVGGHSTGLGGNTPGGTGGTNTTGDTCNNAASDVVDNFYTCDKPICTLGGRSGSWYAFASADVNQDFEVRTPPSGWADKSCAAYSTGGPSGAIVSSSYAGIGLTLKDGAPYDVSAYSGVTIRIESGQPVDFVVRDSGSNYFAARMDGTGNTYIIPFSSLVPMNGTTALAPDLTGIISFEFDAVSPTSYGMAVHSVILND